MSKNDFPSGWVNDCKDYDEFKTAARGVFDCRICGQEITYLKTSRFGRPGPHYICETCDGRPDDV